MAGVTRGQVKRALEWADWLALKPRQREAKGATFPKCVTCGGPANGTHIRGEPRYDCHHAPLRIGDETIERGRRELRG